MVDPDARSVEDARECSLVETSSQSNWTSAVATLKQCAAFVVDTHGGLTISKAYVDDEEVAVTLGAPHDVFGVAASVPLQIKKVGDLHKVRFEYATGNACSAAQWLEPAQTAGKTRPYLFTQCQAIHARSLVPCQDAPGARVSWDAVVDAPAWATALMSGLQANGLPLVTPSLDLPEGYNRSFFKQPVPTSTYLVAIVVADLERREISDRCAVWSEPCVVDAAREEFSETEQFLAAAEEITGQPYVWGRYDLVCLAPSFPYGGMENPCLTFVTPTLLAGDRSLAGVVAHEIAHSWTGNLGSSLLHLIEGLAGEAKFAKFFKAYVKKYRFKTLTSADFRAFATAQLGEKTLKSVDWRAWFHAPGDVPGRMKFVRPLYRALAKSPMPGAKDLAVDTFVAHADFYHPICRKMVASDLGVDLDAPRDAPGPPKTTLLVALAAAGALLVVAALKARR
ncbi:epoxide hydrolase [Aureococcus anophagefferens]|nr:epoxide hydrolase [Aureococcus anophagefferens]